MTIIFTNVTRSRSTAYWYHLKREPGQTIYLWVNTVRERANECKFPPAFHEQAVRDKITFACTEDSTKLKLYDAGAAADLSLDNAIQILLLKEATYSELRESKTARIDYVKRKQGYVSKRTTQFVDQRDKHTLKVNKICGYCNTHHVCGKKNCPAAKNKCRLCQKTGHFQVVCPSARRVNEITVTPATKLTFVGGIDEGNYTILVPRYQSCQKQVYQPSFGELLETDIVLIGAGAGDTQLDTVGFVNMVLVHDTTQISEQVYIVKGASKLLPGVPGIRKLGLVHDLPGTYSIKAINVAELSPPMSKQSVVNEYPKLFSGLGKLHHSAFPTDEKR